MVHRSSSLEEGSQYEYIKCVVVGDSRVGKTCLICAWACGTEYSLERLVRTPTSSVWAIDHYRNDQEVLDRSWCNVDGVKCSLKLWDTFGYHDKNRKFAYRGSDVILLCFSIADPKTLKNIQRFWIPEIKSRCPATPIILVGTHADMRYMYKDQKYKSIDKGLLYKIVRDSDLLPPSSGREVAKEIGAPYYETSVYTKYGIEELFFNVIRATLIERRKLKFWNPQLRRVQYPLIQAPMQIPRPGLPIIKNPGPPPHEDLSILLQHPEDGDVIFDVQGTYIRAHKICLVIADNIFEDLFLTSVKISKKKLQRQGSTSSTQSRTSVKEDKEALINDDFSSDVSYLGNIDMGSNSCQLLNLPGFVKMEDKMWINPQTSVEERKSVVTVDPCISAYVFQYVLEYLYTGKVSESCDCLSELKKAAEIIMLPTLLLMVSNLQTGESYLNTALERDFYAARNKKLHVVGLESEAFSDVRFQLEDGVVAVHKPIVMARCDMMFAMFSTNFKESSANVISFPGMDTVTFSVLLNYLYLGSLPSLSSVDVVALIEAADRLCLKHMIKLLEYKIVTELLEAEENGDCIIEEVLNLIEPAQFHNATDLAIWCLDYVCNNYQLAHHRYFSFLYKLQRDNQLYIAENKWPPEWYTQELEYYQMAARELTPKHMIQQKHQFSRWQRCKSSCLCFGRSRKMVIIETLDED